MAIDVSMVLNDSPSPASCPGFGNISVGTGSCLTFKGALFSSDEEFQSGSLESPVILITAD